MKAEGAVPFRALVGAYLGLIVVGTGLLCLPWATPPAHPISPLDAAFTATSAVCVTGLVVRDTGADFTLFGQLVILALIQLGGLGIMTFSMLVLSALGGRLSLASRSILTLTLAGDGRRMRLGPLLRVVVRFTLIVELAGAGLLFLRFWGPEGAARAAYAALFHSISAFCNAGFSLWSTSLMAYRGDILVNLVVMGLIILGGVGFLVLHEGHRLWKRRQPLSLHSKVTLATTGWLLVIGALGLWLMERRDGLAGMPASEQLVAAAFQTVSARTAGFNTIDLAELTPGGLFFLMLLMFIGGSPGSCAGGIKTTTVGVLVLAAWNRIRGRSRVNVFRRTLGRATLENAVTITIAGMLVTLAGLFALLSFQAPHSSLRELHGDFAAYLFEAISALGTVGLSVGVTSQLAPASRVVVILLMFLGRLGPLTVAIALTRQSAHPGWQHPEEDVMVG
jgi:trk system potassium uptake protein TrkH